MNYQLATVERIFRVLLDSPELNTATNGKARMQCIGAWQRWRSGIVLNLYKKLPE
jgi:hypothetical protein